MTTEKKYTATQILRAYVKMLTIECGDTCNTKKENWQKARRLKHEGKINISMLEHNGYLTN